MINILKFQAILPARRKTAFRRCWGLRQEEKQLFDAVRALRQEELKQLKNKN